MGCQFRGEFIELKIGRLQNLKITVKQRDRRLPVSFVDIILLYVNSELPF